MTCGFLPSLLQIRMKLIIYLQIILQTILTCHFSYNNLILGRLKDTFVYPSISHPPTQGLVEASLNDTQEETHIKEKLCLSCLRWTCQCKRMY